jgi:hypothetical protein
MEPILSERSFKFGIPYVQRVSLSQRMVAVTYHVLALTKRRMYVQRVSRSLQAGAAHSRTCVGAAHLSQVREQQMRDAEAAMRRRVAAFKKTSASASVEVARLAEWEAYWDHTLQREQAKRHAEGEETAQQAKQRCVLLRAAGQGG